MIEQHVLQRSGLPPLRFKGECIANSRTSENRASSYWSGQTGISHIAEVYRYSRGFIVRYSILTQWAGQRDEHQAFICADESALIDRIKQLHPIVADDLFADLKLVEDLEN